MSVFSKPLDLIKPVLAGGKYVSASALNTYTALLKKFINITVVPPLEAVVGPSGISIRFNSEVSQPTGFWAKITGHGGYPDLFNIWRYNWIEVQLNEAGMFTAVSGGRTSVSSGYGYNTIEAFNSQYGVQGSGHTTSNLPAGITILPIGVGAVVWLREHANCNGDFEYLFTIGNVAGGSCS